MTPKTTCEKCCSCVPEREFREWTGSSSPRIFLRGLLIAAHILTRAAHRRAQFRVQGAWRLPGGLYFCSALSWPLSLCPGPAVTARMLKVSSSDWQGNSKTKTWKKWKGNSWTCAKISRRRDVAIINSSNGKQFWTTLKIADPPPYLSFLRGKSPNLSVCEFHLSKDCIFIWRGGGRGRGEGASIWRSSQGKTGGYLSRT